jgi:hypothetical protein
MEDLNRFKQGFMQAGELKRKGQTITEEEQVCLDDILTHVRKLPSRIPECGSTA